jgi:hypothetical protein
MYVFKQHGADCVDWNADPCSSSGAGVSSRKVCSEATHWEENLLAKSHWLRLVMAYRFSFCNPV